MSDFNHIVCPHCAATNRIAVAKNSLEAHCGKCQKMLFNGQPASASDAALEKHIAKNDIPVLVDFWADWCGPCKSMAPNFAKAAAQLEPNIRCLKVDTEAAQASAAKYAIRSIPSLILFKEGKIWARTAGAMDATSLINWVNQSNT